MPQPYIPARETDLVTWADNFATLITATPATYGLTAGDATTIQAAVDTWDSAYAVANSPTTRTPTTIAAKNTAKNAMLPILRSYASQIRLNPGVADADKIALGLNLPNNTPSPVPTPVTAPVVTISANEPLRITLRSRDTGSPATSRARAANTIGMELWVAVGDTAAVDPETASFVGMAVKVPFHVDFDVSQVGSIATFFGRWAVRSGSPGENIARRGPWSSAISQTIVGTG
jgi:hypothetical protein